MGTWARAQGCAGSNYTFLTQKERDDETGLDYFLARYYSSTQGRFTSPDEFVGGPDELYEFEENASANPTFYADLADPQSLNKYQYAYNNPLRYFDPDGHQGRGTLNKIVNCAWDTQIGVDKVGLNLAIGAQNIGADAVGEKRINPLEPSSECQRIAMREASIVAIFSIAFGKPGPANVMVAEAKQSSVVAAETETAMARGVRAEPRVLKSMGQTKNTAKVSSREGNSIPDFQNSTQVGEIKDSIRVSNTRQIRIQRDAASASGREHVIVTGRYTKVSKTAAIASAVKRRSDLGPQRAK